MRRPRTYTALAGAALLALAGLYLVALNTSAVRRLDLSAFGDAVDAEQSPRAHEATARLLQTIDVSSLALLGGAIVLVALIRRRAALAVAAAVLVAGANLMTQALKAGLGHLDLLGGETARASAGAFPSGHATVAMSLALALVLVAPASQRPLAALVGMAYAVGVGIAVVALGWHFPSDVGGAYLVAAAWACAVAAALSAHGRRGGFVEPPGTPPARRLAVGAACAIVVVAFLVLLALAAGRRRALLQLSELHTAFVLAALLIAALGAFMTATLAALLRRAPQPR